MFTVGAAFASLQLRASPVRASLPYDFTDEVIFTDEVSAVRFVAARLSPFKVYRSPVVRTPGDGTSRQESKPAWLSSNLAVILQRVFVYYCCMCLKSHIHIFIFLLELDNVYVYLLMVAR